MIRRIIILWFISIFLFKKNYAQELNLDMERVVENVPMQWKKGFNELQAKLFSIESDSVVRHGGRYSLKISSIDENDIYGNVYITIPATYSGNIITLKGFLRTENVEKGFAGLLLLTGDEEKTLQFDNMQNRGLKGTNDWKEFTITLPYSELATRIYLGAVFSGKGTVWIDDLSLQIDNIAIQQAPRKKVYPAELDTAFNSGSGINDVAVTEQNIEALNVLGQLWVFLKYHHTEVALGNYNWDAELMRILPKVLDAKNKDALMKQLEKWLDRFPKPDSCRTCAPYQPSTFIKLDPDYGELFTPGYLSSSLEKKLSYVLRNWNRTNHYYIEMASGVGYPVIKNEKSYPKMESPDAGFRLLALYRYWGLIQYFFPNRHLIGEDWNKVLKEYIPVFLNAHNAEAYSLACLSLIARIRDTHAGIWSYNKALNEYRGLYSPPFTAKFVENKLVVDRTYTDSAATQNRLSHGDIITHVDGKEIEEYIKELLPYTPGSNFAAQLRDMPPVILRGKTDYVRLTVLHDNQPQEINIPRYLANAIQRQTPVQPESYKLINENIGYVYPGTYHNESLPMIKEQFRNSKGIIIDMRCYPSEFMPFTFGNYIKKEASPFVTFTFGNVSRPGLFLYGQTLSNGGTNTDAYQGKVVVIVNETTQSQAEYTTMAFQSSPNVTVIGSTTSGADGNISTFSLPGGISTAFSGIGVFYPDRTETQRVGVKIDIVIKPTIKAFRERKDELLEKAIELINQ